MIISFQSLLSFPDSDNIYTCLDNDPELGKNIPLSETSYIDEGVKAAVAALFANRIMPEVQIKVEMSKLYSSCTTLPLTSYNVEVQKEKYFTALYNCADKTTKLLFEDQT